MQNLGEFLRYARKSKGITQEELASEMHVVSPVISKWENGKSIPDLTALCKLCNILNISLEECLACNKLEEPLILPPNNYDAQKLGEKLKDLRLKNNLSQSDVGKDLFVTSQTVSRWESGGMTSLDNLQLICKYYEIPISAIFQYNLPQSQNYNDIIGNSGLDRPQSTTVAPKRNLAKFVFIVTGAIVIIALSVASIFAFTTHSHTLVYFDAVAPTCDTAGNIAYWQCTECNNCFSDTDGKNQVFDVSIEKTGHDFGEWKTLKNPTCSNLGVEERICHIDNVKENRVLECLPHQPKYISDEITHTERCELCGDILESDVSHTFDDGICSICGHAKFECIAPLDEYTLGMVFFLDPVFIPGHNYYYPHRAVDFNAPGGSEVKCIFDGVVKDITNDGYYGTSVYIEHIYGFVSVYQLLRETNLQIGDKVAKGDIIGEISDTALEVIMDDPHLCLTLYKDDEEVDPLDYMPDVERPPDDYIKNFQ